VTERRCERTSTCNDRGTTRDATANDATSIVTIAMFFPCGNKRAEGNDPGERSRERDIMVAALSHYRIHRFHRFVSDFISIKIQDQSLHPSSSTLEIAER